jgi:hypothetical protein
VRILVIIWEYTLSCGTLPDRREIRYRIFVIPRPSLPLRNVCT